ncbi:hypothetical protein SAMN02927903_00476 [Flavobacterium caeni]|uniref:Uncharacterized protein n=1 Tax=Flavobacterium caeni TaxID=490189 RepID=A0A1G5BTV7_9FLAO|nr:hypothetical protein SAMN02927903_00476 [Flavobacterium caeni]
MGLKKNKFLHGPFRILIFDGCCGMWQPGRGITSHRRNSRVRPRRFGGSGYPFARHAQKIKAESPTAPHKLPTKAEYRAPARQKKSQANDPGFQQQSSINSYCQPPPRARYNSTSEDSLSFLIRANSSWASSRLRCAMMTSK